MVNPEDALKQLQEDTVLVEKENTEELLVDQGIVEGDFLAKQVADNQKVIEEKTEEEPKVEVKSTKPWQRHIQSVFFRPIPRGVMTASEKMIGEVDVTFVNGMILRGIRVVQVGVKRAKSFRMIMPVISNIHGKKVMACSPNSQQKGYIEEAIINDLIENHGL